jgi:hypothetical protein
MFIIPELLEHIMNETQNALDFCGLTVVSLLRSRIKNRSRHKSEKRTGEARPCLSSAAVFVKKRSAESSAERFFILSI